MSRSRISLVVAGLAAVALTLLAAQDPGEHPTAPGVPPPQTEPAAGVRPSTVAFEANLGQVDPATQFLARAGQFRASLDASGLRLSGVSARSNGDEPGLRPHLGPARAPSQDARLVLVGARPEAMGDPAEALPGLIHYLTADRSVTGVPAYRVVAYRQAYPGIDVLYRGADRGIAIDLAVAADADLAAFALEVAGGQGVALENGQLVARLAAGEIRIGSPVVLEPADATASWLPVAGASFGIGLSVPGPGAAAIVRVTVSLAGEDESGWPGLDGAPRLATDAGGNTFVAGRVAVEADEKAMGEQRPGRERAATDRRPAAGVARTKDLVDVADAFAVKLGPDRETILQTTYFGGRGADVPLDVAVDAAGRLVIVGSTTSPALPGAVAGERRPGTKDAFVAVMAKDGATIEASAMIGGSDDDAAQGVAFDTAGRAWIAGRTTSGDLPVTGDALHTAPLGEADAFVVALDPSDGLTTVYASYLGGTAEDAARDVVVDASNRAIVAGTTHSPEFAPADGASGRLDGFVVALDPTARSLAWSARLGGSQDDEIAAIAIDSGGRIVVAGTSRSADFPLVAPLQPALTDPAGGPAGDGFVALLDGNGSGILFSTYLGGAGDDRACDVAVDAAGRAWVVGITDSPDFPVIGGKARSLGGSMDAFVAEIDLDRAELLQSTHLGGAAGDVASGLALLPEGGALVAGATRSPDLAAKRLERSAVGGDAFVAQIAATPRALGCPGAFNFDNNGGAGDNQWTTPTNWDTGTLPSGATADVCIDGFNVTLSSGTQTIVTLKVQGAGSLTLTGGTLNISSQADIDTAFTVTHGSIGGGGSVNVDGLFTWNGFGTLGGTGSPLPTFTANGGTLIDTTFSRSLNRIFVNPVGDTVNWVNGTVTLGVDGARIDNAGTWICEHPGDLQLNGAATNRPFNNLSGATFRKILPSTGTIGITYMDTQFVDAGTTTVEAGVYSLRNGGTYTGSLTVDAGTQLFYSGGTHNLNTGSTLTAPGDVDVTTGTVNVSGTANFDVSGDLTLTNGALNFSNTGTRTIADFIMTHGTLGGTSNVAVGGLFTWNGFGTLGGTGSPLPTFTANGGTLIDTTFSRSLNRIFVNPVGDTVNWVNGTVTLGVDGARIDNAGTWICEHPGDLQLNGAATNRPFNNLSGATFRKILPSTGTIGITYMDTQFVDAGTTTVEAGVYSLRNGGTYTGSLTVDAGTQLFYSGGTHNLNTGSTLTAPGDVDVTTGTVNVSGTANFDVSGDLTLTNGALNFSNTGTRTIADFIMTHGTLGGTSNVAVGGLFTWNGFGTLGGTGSPLPTFTANGGTLIDTTFSRSLNRIFVNPVGDTVNWVNGTVTLGVDGARIDNAGTWICEHPGDLQLNGAATNRPFNNLSGATFRKIAPSAGTVGITYMDTQFVDAGTTTVEAGVYSLRNGGTYTGSLTVDAGTQLFYSGGTHNLNAGSTLTAPGDVEITSGTVNFNATASLDMTGDLRLTNGVLNFTNTGTQAIADFIVTHGTLGGTSNVAVGGLFTWNGFGTLGGTGSPLPTFTANGGTLIDTTFSRSLNRIFVNPVGDTVNWVNGTVTLGVDGARIDNAGTWICEHPGDLQLNGTPANRPFNNLSGATFRKIAPSAGTVGITYMDTQFVDAGTTTVEAGVYSLRNGGTYTGSLTVDAGTQLFYSGGTHNLNAGSTLTAPGDVEITSGTVNFNATANLDMTGDLRLTNGVLNFTNTGTQAIADFIVTHGTLGGTSNVAVGGLFTWNGFGTLGGTGSPLPTFTANGGTLIDTTFSRSLNRIFVNPVGDTVNWVNGTVTLGVDGARIDNAGTWICEHPGDLQLNGTPANRPFNNLSGATFRKIAPSAGTVGITYMDTQFVDAGTTTVEAGVYSLRNGGTYTGSLTVDAGTQLFYSGGTHNLNAGSTLTAPGDVEITSGTVNFNATANLDMTGDLRLTNGVLNFTNTGTQAIADFIVTHGTLGGTSNVAVGGLFTWNGFGTLGGTGSLLPTFTANGGTLITTTFSRSLNRIFVNPVGDTVSWENGTVTLGVDGARIDNAGTWICEHPGDLQLNGTATNRPFNNLSGGTFRKIAPSAGTVGITYMDTQFVDAGTTTVEAGVYSLRNGGTYTGSLTVDAGTQLFYSGGTHNLNAGSTLTAPGNVEVTTGTVNFNATANLDMTGDLRLTNGVLNFTNTGTQAIADFIVTHGTLGGTSNVTVGGLFTWNGFGTLGGTGSPLPTFTANGGSLLDTTFTKTLNRTFVNPAGDTVNWVNGPISMSVDGARIDNAGTWVCEHPGDIQLNGTAANRPFNNLAGATFRKIVPSTGTVGITYVDTALANAGTLDIEAGTLSPRSAFNQSGGTTRINGGTIVASVALNFAGGSLVGVGSVTAPSVNNTGGQVSPGLSPAAFGVVGDFSQGLAGAYVLELGGLTAGTEHDQLNVTDASTFTTADANLNGTLDVRLINGFMPMIGDTFTILTAENVVSGFSNVTTNPPLGCGVDWGLTYDPTSVTLEFIAVASADLDVSKSDAPDPVAVGDTLTYTVIVDNQGPETAANAVLTDTLPSGVTFVSAVATQGSCSQASGVVTCTLGSLADGASATVTIRVTPDAPGNLTNSATATSDSCDPVPGNDTDTSDTTARPACADADADGFAVCNASCTPFANDVCGDCSDTEPNCTTDCSDNNGNSTPDCAEICPDVDNDTFAVCDGICGLAAGDQCGDCDDTNPAINPGATEIAGDGVDQNCDGAEVCFTDADNDGYRPNATSTVASTDGDCADAGEAVAGDPTGDCNDTNPAINPGATEITGDGVDQNCDGAEVCFTDADNDGYRPNATSTMASADVDCADAGEAVAGDPTGDCNDTNPAINPGATEIAGDGVDQNCDAAELCFTDADNDGYRPNATSTVASADVDCVDSGEAVAGDPTGDCNDAVAAINPGATEVAADGVDQNCDGGELCFTDADNDGHRPNATSTVTSADIDCVDPGEAVSTDPTGDCNDAVAAISPGATEIAGDSVDQNCDGAEVCFLDVDNDGYRPNTTSTVASTDTDCLDPGEAAAGDPTSDCDDADAAINPGSPETGTAACADGIDNDCDGTADVLDPGCAVAITLCANLGDQPPGEAVDQDVWTFLGEVNEVVMVTLDASGTATGHADLILVDEMGTAVDFFQIDRSDLPNSISTTLPATGAYRLAVVEHPAALILPGRPYRGDYCVTFDGNLGAAQSLAPTSSVETP